MTDDGLYKCKEHWIMTTKMDPRAADFVIGMIKGNSSQLEISLTIQASIAMSLHRIAEIAEREEKARDNARCAPAERR